MSTAVPSRHTDWIQTFTGGRFFPLAARSGDINIVDIAHALSNLCRFGGHSNFFYSVAQHCVLVSYAVPAEFAFHGLLHDASEAYLIDVPRPIKRAPGMESYRIAEKQLQRAIYQHFGLSPEEPECVKKADLTLLRTEQRDLLKPAPADWEDNREGALDETIIPLLPFAAKNLFWNRYIELSNHLPLVKEIA